MTRSYQKHTLAQSWRGTCRSAVTYIMLASLCLASVGCDSNDTAEDNLVQFRNAAVGNLQAGLIALFTGFVEGAFASLESSADEALTDGGAVDSTG